ncbi:hypothetical protein VNO78_24396 [Psophocarpus tetragonolobus]|uniref:Uncharacterized protein n=1 Tax=Psophocarpus tetragonolobus TaxID=3891 RepID=A0AAN9S678_PSOTE
MVHLTVPSSVGTEITNIHRWGAGLRSPYLTMVVPSQISSVFFRCRKEIPSPAFKNDEDEVRGAAGTMDPLTPNRVAFPGLAGLACRS